MYKNIRWITRTAVMLAALIGLQWAGSLIPDQLTKQLVTGTFVNCVLAVTALLVGLSGSITVALISPLCAFLLGIAPNLITVAPIMAGNACYVALLWLILGRKPAPLWKQSVGLIAAAGVKFALLYGLVVEVICGLAADGLMGKKLGGTVLLAPKMLDMLPAMFTWPQLITALLGGTVALLCLPALRKAVK